jgi:hypothetical protein
LLPNGGCYPPDTRRREYIPIVWGKGYYLFESIKYNIVIALNGNHHTDAANNVTDNFPYYLQPFSTAG